MQAKELTSDIGRIFNKALGIFKKASPNPGDLTSIAGGGALNALRHVIVVDDLRLLGPVDLEHVDYVLGGQDNATQTSLDKWFAEILFKQLTNLASGDASADDRFLFLINVGFRPLRGGKRSHRDGLRILEHIRFTEALPDQIRFSPVVLYGFEANWQLLAHIQHPLLMEGAGVAFARLPEDLPSLSASDRLEQWAVEAGQLNASKMQQMLNPSIELGGGELYAHSYRNTVGAPRFCWEFAGDILGEDHEVFSRFRTTMQESLQLKRLFAIQPHLQPGEIISEADRRALSDVCRDIRLLVIDDEHSTGWSLGLYAGITGTSLDYVSYESFCKGDRNWSSDGRMCALASVDRAEEFLRATLTEFQTALGGWTAAFDAYKEAEERSAASSGVSLTAQSELKKAELRLAAATTALQNHETTYKKHWQTLDDLLRQSSAEITEALLVTSRQNESHVEIPSTRHVTSISPELIRCGTELAKLGAAVETLRASQKQWDEAANSIDALDTNVAELRSVAEAKEKERITASARADQAKAHLDRSDVELARAYKFNVVFLDLRIDPSRDSALHVAKSSGIKLLKSIRNDFPEIPVIIMTASEKAESLRVAFANGAAGYWIKGISNGAEMVPLAKAAATRAALLPLWLKTKKVAARSYLTGKEYHPPGSGLRRGSFTLRKITSADERAKIESCLREALFILSDQMEVASNSAAAFDPVIINLAKIQELRFSNIIDPNGNTKPGWQDAPPQEQELRRLRNDVAHSKGRMAAHADAVKYLHFTLDQLLL